MTLNTTTPTFGAPKISTPTATGPTSATTAGSGGRIRPLSTPTSTGRLIVMAVGFGFRRTVGPGWARNPGVGLLITTAAGSTTTVIGRGRRAVIITGSAVGGGRRWWRFTFSLATTFAGIRSLTIT